MKLLLADEVYVDSCGAATPEPDELDPFVVAR